MEVSLLSEIGQPTFVEVVWVDPYEGEMCESIAILGRSRWQNPVNRFDVNNDGVVDESDYNTLLSWIGSNSSTLPANKPSGSPFVDVNGDGVVDENDLQQLSNFLNGVPIDQGISQVCHDVSDFRIERDLLDPAQISGCSSPTVRAVACAKNVIPTSDYTPYFNHYTSLVETSLDAIVKTKDSILFVHNDLLISRNQYFQGCSDTPRILNRILAKLNLCPRYDPRHPCPEEPPFGTEYIPPGPIDDPVSAEPPDIISDTTTTTTTVGPSGLLERVVIINIFGKAERYLTPEWWGDGSYSGDHYIDDRIMWETFFDSIADNNGVNVRAGIIHPLTTANASLNQVFPPGRDLPGDSQRDVIDYITVDEKNPRLGVNDIVNAFHVITQNGSYSPTLLIIADDVSEDSQWASQISLASRRLQDDFPDMEIMKYPLTDAFSRWMMMDLDAMYQLIYQNDTINLDLTSKYRTGAPVGIIQDGAPFMPLRKDHIEYRLLNNDVNVKKMVVELGDDPSNPQLGSPVNAGRIDYCFGVATPDYLTVREKAFNDTSTNDIRLDASPFWTYFGGDTMAQQLILTALATNDLGQCSHAMIRNWGAFVYDSYLLSIHPWVLTWFGGTQQNILVDQICSANKSDAQSQFAGNATSINPLEGYGRASSANSAIYPVLHIDPFYGIIVNTHGGPWVSVWFNTLHAIVTYGNITGPRGKGHYSVEEQRQIAIYSDPDFQDKIYNKINSIVSNKGQAIFATRSGFTVGAGTFDLFAYTAALVAAQVPPSGRPGDPLWDPGSAVVDPSPFTKRCPEYPLSDYYTEQLF